MIAERRLLMAGTASSIGVWPKLGVLCPIITVDNDIKTKVAAPDVTDHLI